MIEFEDWAARRPFGTGADFLLLGKGPTYSKRDQFDLTGYVTISLNHVVRQQPVDIAHMIDFEVAEECAEQIKANARWLLMPRHPHLAFEPTILSLEELVRHVPGLAALEAENRIVCYDLAAGHPRANGMQITAQFFSSEAAADLAGFLGARRVFTLGVDGGTHYAGTFSDLSGRTRLANGQPSFSRQFSQLDQVAARHNMDWEPLVPPLKIFIGVQERELIAARVLEFTIEQYATKPIQVIHLPSVRREPIDPRKRQRTPFSFSRFLIPELAGFRGRALYLDSDMQVFDDISTLWDIPFEGSKVLCTSQTYVPPQWRDNPSFHPGRQLSVMMLDCTALHWDVDQIIDALDEDQLTYEDLMFGLTIVPDHDVRDGLPEGWNHLEHFVPGVTKLLHYTAVPTQPWKSRENPNRSLWEDAFVQACEAGFVSAELVDRHVRAGHVRPSLRDLMPPVRATRPASLSATAAELRAARITLNRGSVPRRAMRAVRSRLRPAWHAAETLLRSGG